MNRSKVLIFPTWAYKSDMSLQCNQMIQREHILILEAEAGEAHIRAKQLKVSFLGLQLCDTGLKINGIKQES